MTTNRQIKDALYDQVARVAKALASPKRLELLELLSQAPKSVETLARQADIDIKLASAHLKALRAARLVDAERSGKYVIYRPAGTDVPHFCASLRGFAERRLVELQDALRQIAAANGEWHLDDRTELIRKVRAGEIVVIDVRPVDEYRQAHLPAARSMPLVELRARLDELPRDKPIVAYCRGPFCLMSADAVRILREAGFAAWPLRVEMEAWSSTTDEPARCTGSLEI